MAPREQAQAEKDGMTTPCPQSPKGLPCLFAPHRVGNEQRTLLACLTCGRAKQEETKQ